MKNIALLWSGGKDSAFTLYKLLQNNYNVKFLITTINYNFKRVSIHGIREELIEKQAEHLGIPLQKVYVKTSANDEYEEKMIECFKKLKEQGIDVVASGDIFLEDLREYREKLFAKAGVQGVFPLWKEDTDKLVREFINEGFKSVICSVSDNFLDDSYLGEVISYKFLERLPESVDSCGENGEFHSYCFAGPIFIKPINIRTGEKVYKPVNIKLKCPMGKDANLPKGIWYIDVDLD